MIHQISGRNVNETFHEALWKLKVDGHIENSRNGRVITLTQPALICNTQPMERVLFCPERKENPFFHFMECLWMMAGSNEADWIAEFNPRMAQYADGGTGQFHGAYGYRWRHHFSVDQVLETTALLKADPTTRRAVIDMWSPKDDLGTNAADIPCNTQIYFRVVEGRLNMTVLNRSNDLVWGALGSNIVHFSFLQELIAHGADLQVGTLWQFTNNLHVYERHWKFVEQPPRCSSYRQEGVSPTPIISKKLSGWLRDCERFIAKPEKTSSIADPFFATVAYPILHAWKYKDPKYLELCAAKDWGLACTRYLERLRAAEHTGLA